MNGEDVVRWFWQVVQFMLEVSSLLWGIRLAVNWRGAARDFAGHAQLLEPLRERWGLDETWWRLAGLAAVGSGIFGVSRSLPLSSPSRSALALAGIGIDLAGLCGVALRTRAAIRARRGRPTGPVWG
jgi:hypothetical protein